MVQHMFRLRLVFSTTNSPFASRTSDAAKMSSDHGHSHGSHGHSHGHHGHSHAHAHGHEHSHESGPCDHKHGDEHEHPEHEDEHMHGDECDCGHDHEEVELTEEDIAADDSKILQCAKNSFAESHLSCVFCRDLLPHVPDNIKALPKEKQIEYVRQTLMQYVQHRKQAFEGAETARACSKSPFAEQDLYKKYLATVRVFHCVQTNPFSNRVSCRFARTTKSPTPTCSTWTSGRSQSRLSRFASVFERFCITRMLSLGSQIRQRREAAQHSHRSPVRTSWQSATWLSADHARLLTVLAFSPSIWSTRASAMSCSEQCATSSSGATSRN